ncbi:hypothetical protein Pmani_037968 [Petrolisthes manimaculis]|uniref:Uncharacterized protein n=1 Tax=Petrolisthes manimaculis TaxID=1843537 RepID=A0AAE1NFF3_9EUCA|nr:hypothetical protein Pmani_037968 [Petrolisthes manimaculis]
MRSVERIGKALLKMRMTGDWRTMKGDERAVRVEEHNEVGSSVGGVKKRAGRRGPTSVYGCERRENTEIGVVRGVDERKMRGMYEE